MNKKELCTTIQSILWSIRQEESLSQEVMADKIGVSKKTYIQLEKGRTELRWAETVTICTVFQDSLPIQQHFGDDIIEIIQVVAFQKMPHRQLPTLGGTIWWNTIKQENGFTLQQHKISQHYRILDEEEYRIYFTLSKADALHRLNRYLGKNKEE